MKPLAQFSLSLLVRFAAAVGVIVFLPALLFIAFLIHSTGGAPVLLTDEVTAHGGIVGRCWRFRTTGQGTPMFRIIGRFLRSGCADDWPGLWSVARGDISLRDFLKWR